MQLAFGSGSLFGQRTDIAGSTPLEFGVLQDCSAEFSFTKKELNGQYSMPIAVGRGSGKIACKAKFAQINALNYASLFFGSSVSTGLVLTALNEPFNVPAAAPYTYVVANAASYAVDLGVKYQNGGIPLTKVASNPVAGQYAVNAATGTITLAAADQGVPLLTSYTWKSPTGGSTIALTNQLMGAAPTFQVNLSMSFGNKALNLQLNANTSDKLSFATKLDDWMIPEFDWSAMADSSNVIGYLSLVE